MPIISDTTLYAVIHIDTRDRIPYISRNEKQVLLGFAVGGGRKESVVRGGTDCWTCLKVKSISGLRFPAKREIRKNPLPPVRSSMTGRRSG